MNAAASPIADSLECFESGTRGVRATQMVGPRVDLVELAVLSFLQGLIDELYFEAGWDWILADVLETLPKRAGIGSGVHGSEVCQYGG